ncbi:MAG: hypothetical protein E7077_05860 [Bacteroidales bacterium]|jgi:hypothetical protein|nr:hypothetical protein [Bacteroidales bacterium]
MKTKNRSSVLEDFAKSLNFRQKVDVAVPTTEINSEHFEKPDDIDVFKDCVDSLSSSDQQAGLISIKKVIKDRSTFIRLYLSHDTVNAFLCLNAIASFKLIAWIVDFLTDTEDNCIIFDQDLLPNYNLTKKSYRTAVKDLQKCGVLRSEEFDGEKFRYVKGSYKYYVNPAIFQCGDVSVEAFQTEKKVRKKYDKIITDPRIMAKLGIRNSSFETVASHFFLPDDDSEKKKGTQIKKGVYISSLHDDLPPFFKVFRGSFSSALLSLKHKCSAKVIAFIIDTYLPKDKDVTKISRSNLCDNVIYPISRSTYYRAIGDILRSGMIYRDKTNKKYYINPSAWYNGTAFQLLKSCMVTSDSSEKFLTKKQKKRRQFAKYLNAYLYKETTLQLYNNA